MLALELEVQSRSILEYLASRGFDAGSVSSPLDDENAKKVREWFRQQQFRAEQLKTGQVAWEYFEVCRQLDVLQNRLQGYMDLFAKLAKALGEVDYVVFDEEQWPPDFHGRAGVEQSDYRFQSEAIGGKILKTLCNDIRATKAKHAQLAKHLKSLGFHLPTKDPN